MYDYINKNAPRSGKTVADRKSGATARNIDNKAARVKWQQDPRESFPLASCNGKRNHRRFTGKGNETIILY